MTTPLTQLPVTPRKRTRRTAEDDSADMPSSKRRELGASSVARHKKRNVTPYSERRRRKALEDKGRIDKTIFRIPELISQNKTDQDTADSSKSYSTDRDQEPDWKVLDQMRADLQSQEETEQPAPPQTPQTPQTPTRGWHFRGLLDSVPRSLARFIPTIANSPSRTPRQTDDSVPDQFTTPPETSRSPVSPAQQKNTLLQPTQPLEKRDLSYSLYPPPIDRSSFLEPISPPIPTPREPISEVATPHPSTPQVSTPQVSTSQVPTPRTAVTNENQAESSGNKPNVPPTKSKKRRKKTIPNPPGCSYGMDMRYFGDTTSESETDTDADDESEEPVRGLTTKPTQRTIRGILRGRKRVRFDASPEDVPSKLRLRERQYPRPARSQRIAAQPSASYEETPSTPITTSTPIASSTPLISTPITTSTPTASTPISSTPISSAPITATPITATPITATPITATPISSAPITATPIAATPIASTPITTSTPTTSTPTSSIPTTSTPITNHSGTYCLDYDMFSSSDEEMEEETQAQPDEVMAAENTQQESQNVDNAPVTEMAQQETLTNVNIAPVAENPQEETQTNAAEASVVEQGRTTQADVVSAGGEGEAGRLLNPAEKYRPRQPSKLRVSHRYSSPIAPLAEASPSGVNISRLVEEMWSPEDQESADAVFNREFGRFCRSRLEEGEGEEGGEGGEVGGEGGEEEEGRAVVPFQLDSYGEFCSALEGYRRGR
ncbi:hypothetical protein FQN50_006265 [Emmonsiellopsis sp. PD_5]|nr:hypothetical protein FQN50_006265 [Emmonsiellopsis sp. PD_5]